MSATQRFNLDDIEGNGDGTVREVIRVRYRRKADEPDVCPFCESGDRVEWVDKIGEGGQWRTQRYECECGAHGERFWTWAAGTLEAPENVRESDGDSR